MFNRIKIFLLLTPALLIIILLFFGGLFFGLIRSLNYMPVIGLTDLNFNAFISVFKSKEFYDSLFLSFYISFASTFISTIFAIGAALLLRRSFVGKSLVNFLFQINLTVPHLIGAIGILYLFSQSGSFARLAFQWGVITKTSEFPEMVYDPYAIGIILQYVWKEIPFIGVIVLANVNSLVEDYENVARSLGANKWQTFRYVLLPFILPSVLLASVIVFAFTFGAYEIPAMLGANYPSALSVLAYRKYTDVDLASMPEAMAISIIIAFLSCLMIFFYLKFARKKIRE